MGRIKLPSTYNHKRGDSLQLSGQLSLGDLVDFTGWSARSFIRDQADEKIAEFVFTWLDASQGLCTLSLQDTTAFDVARYKFDVEFTAPDGAITSTPTVTLNVQKDITWSS